MSIDFPAALLLVGVVLVVAAGLSGWLHGTVLSVSVLAVAAGVGLSAAGVITASPGDPSIVYVVELALLVTLFSDGLIAERELVSERWHPPARALLIAMPITLGLLAVAARLLFPELSWAEAMLLGAVLSPTDPVITSTIVTGQRVPEIVRHTLNLESGLNDGLALPFVLVLLAVSTGGAVGEAVPEQVLETVGGGVIGLLFAFLAGRALDHLPGGAIARNYEGVYALGVALAAFGLAEVTYGNGLIAAFVAGVGIGIAERDVPDAFGEFNENVSAVLQVVTFLLFGALIVATGYQGDVIALGAFIVFALLVARPAAIGLAFVGSPLRSSQKLFIAWFGPKGVASMLFALFVLNSSAPDRTLVFDVASFVILASIAAHGLTDTVGAKWIERRLTAD